MYRALFALLVVCGLVTINATNASAQLGVPVQTSAPSLGQNPRYATLLKPTKYLALDVTGAFGFRRYRFHEGDELRFKARGQVYRESLYAVTDTSFSILVDNEIMNRAEAIAFRFNEVQWIKIDRRIPFVSAGAVLLPLAGAVFAIADFVNPKADDGRGGRFVLDPTSLIPAGALAASGLLCYKLSHSRYRINQNHRLKALGH